MTYAALDENQRRFLKQVVYNVAIRWERTSTDRQKAFEFTENLGHCQFFSQADRCLLSQIFWQASENPGYYLRSLYKFDPYNDFRLVDSAWPDETLAITMEKLGQIKSLVESHIPVNAGAKIDRVTP